MPVVDEVSTWFDVSFKISLQQSAVVAFRAPSQPHDHCWRSHTSGGDKRDRLCQAFSPTVERHVSAHPPGLLSPNFSPPITLGPAILVTLGRRLLRGTAFGGLLCPF